MAVNPTSATNPHPLPVRLVLGFLDFLGDMRITLSLLQEKVN
jgi:hypothetical protein